MLENKNHNTVGGYPHPAHCSGVPVSKWTGVPVSWCPSVLVSQCHSVPVSRCPSITVSQCPHVPMSWYLGLVHDTPEERYHCIRNIANISLTSKPCASAALQKLGLHDFSIKPPPYNQKTHLALSSIYTARKSKKMTSQSKTQTVKLRVPAPCPLFWCPGVQVDWCPSVLVSQCFGVPVSQCHSIPVSRYHSVPVSPCPNVLVSWCPGVPMSQCPGVPISQCTSVPVTCGGQRNTQAGHGETHNTGGDKETHNFRGGETHRHTEVHTEVVPT